MTASREFPILDRVPFLDDRSKRPEYSARRILGATARFKRIWSPRLAGPLDQGREGACVGFACASELAATPIKYTVDNDAGLRIYKAARYVDRDEGRVYRSGATLIAGMKACAKGELFGKYVWNFGEDDTIDWVVRRGPVILGIQWHHDMYSPSANGLITVGGGIAGGHAIMANGFWPAHPDFGDVIILTNSWGKGWGINGRGFLRIPDLRRLLSEDGESVAPTDLPLKPVLTNGDN